MTTVEHVHEWLTFEGGRGCTGCPAWSSFPRGTHLIDALPTSLLQQPPAPSYGALVSEDDVVLEVMHLLMGVARADVSWAELEGAAVQVIELVRA